VREERTRATNSEAEERRGACSAGGSPDWLAAAEPWAALVPWRERPTFAGYSVTTGMNGTDGLAAAEGDYGLRLVALVGGMARTHSGNGGAAAVRRRGDYGWRLLRQQRRCGERVVAARALLVDNRAGSFAVYLFASDHTLNFAAHRGNAAMRNRW